LLLFELGLRATSLEIPLIVDDNYKFPIYYFFAKFLRISRESPSHVLLLLLIRLLLFLNFITDKIY